MVTNPKPERAIRVDRGQLRAPVVTDEGFLQVEGYVARAGIFEYLNTPADEENGYGRVGTIRRELKPREEVFSPKTLAQYAGATLTAEHPPGNRVTPENARHSFVGTVKAGRVDGERAAVTMVIQDKDTIARVKRGELNELSPGTAAMIHRTPGADRSYATPSNPEGKYDCIQRDIDVNHLALTDFSRCGKDLRIRADSTASDFAAIAGVEIRGDAFDGKLTSVVDGHQHLLTPCDWNGSSSTSGETSWAVSEGADGGHGHPWVKAPDGTFTIGESAGHTHSILDDRRYQAPAATSPRGDSMTTDLSKMPADEQIRFLQAKHDELVAANAGHVAKIAGLETDLAAKTARVDSLSQVERTQIERIEALRTQIASGAVVAETEALKKLQVRVDSAETELEKLRAAQPEIVRKRAELLGKAKAVLGPEFRTDSLEDRAIQEHIVRKLRPNENVGGLNAAQVESRCDSLYADAQTAAIELQRPVFAPPVAEIRADSSATPKPLSHRDQWKRGLPDHQAR